MGANKRTTFISKGNEMKKGRGCEMTQTTVLKGAFKNDAGTKKEFFDNIKLQQDFAPR
jgi:GTP cyclohydrolase I